MTTGTNGAAPAAPAAPPRNNAGQFSPKDGAVGVVPAEEQQGQAPAAGKPAGPPAIGWDGWDGSGEVELEGRKIPVKYGSKTDVLNEARELRWRRQREKAVADREKQLEQLLNMEPDEFLKLRGVDPDKRYRERVIADANALEMTPEQRQAAKDRAELAALKAEREEAKKQAEAQQKAQARAQLRQRVVAEMESALEASGLPQTHATMALLAEIQEEATANGGPPLTKEQLAAEANKRYAERGVEPLKKLQGQALLDRLGTDVVRAVLLAERDRRAGSSVVQPTARASVDSREPVEQSKTYGEAEAARLLREMRNGNAR